MVVRHKVRRAAFVDDDEMADILSREELLERITRGSREARRKKGRMTSLDTRSVKKRKYLYFQGNTEEYPAFPLSLRIPPY